MDEKPKSRNTDVHDLPTGKLTLTRTLGGDPLKSSILFSLDPGHSRTLKRLEDELMAQRGKMEIELEIVEKFTRGKNQVRIAITAPEALNVIRLDVFKPEESEKVVELCTVSSQLISSMDLGYIYVVRISVETILAAVLDVNAKAKMGELDFMPLFYLQLERVWPEFEDSALRCRLCYYKSGVRILKNAFPRHSYPKQSTKRRAGNAGLN
ncbi:hypothetical protein JNK13_09305 [bacterium]|nr:hypothetical protein [bacterium]